MKGTLSLLSFAACALATAVACGKQSPQPSAPSAIDPEMIQANPDGSNLKVTAPTPESPINGVRLPQGEPVVLTFGNSTPRFTAAVPLSYRIELMDAAGGNVETAVFGSESNPTSREVTAALEGEQTYRWRVRAEYEGAFGPWSPIQSFVAPQNEGYIRGGEVYDPLINGKTVGQIHGPVTFIPNQGVRLDSEDSWITYPVQPGQLTSGQFSALFKGLTVVSQTENPKNSILAMSRDNGAAFNDNPYRMSVEVRGNGAVAFRFIAGRSGYAETVGAERRRVAFHENLTYFAEASWDSGFFHVTFREGGFDGTTVYDYGKPYAGTYSPSPHSAFVGRPWTPGTRDSAASYEGAIVRQVWLSSRPRPASINQ